MKERNNKFEEKKVFIEMHGGEKCKELIEKKFIREKGKGKWIKRRIEIFAPERIKGKCKDKFCPRASLHRSPRQNPLTFRFKEWRETTE